jgi:hypothetical protein
MMVVSLIKFIGCREFWQWFSPDPFDRSGHRVPGTP